MSVTAPEFAESARAEAALAAGRRIWVGLSGGLDSASLLHALVEHWPGRVRAIHVHHGLQAAADGWAEHCRQLCEPLKVPITVVRVRVGHGSDQGLEAAAREARYAAYAEALDRGDVLVLAHHRGDQAETVLMRLFRGSGIAGLAGMACWSERDAYLLWRPWLGVPRAAIGEYARRRGLRWVDDPQNGDERYARVRVRQHLMPQILEHWAGAELAMARFAQHCTETQSLLDALAAQDLHASQRGHRLTIGALLALDAARRRNVLRWWLRREAGLTLSADRLCRLDRELLAARPDGKPVVQLEHLQLRRYRDQLYLGANDPEVPENWSASWSGASDLRLPAGCGVLRLEPAPVRFDIRVSFPKGGERIRPSGSPRTRSLKNLFQESATPPWVRRRTPLLWSGEELVAIADRWLTEGFEAQLARAGTALVWRPAGLQAGGR